MKIINVKNSTWIIAGIFGLIFALVYTGLEILNENPAATHSISIWHTPLIWLLSSSLLYLILYSVKVVRSGEVKERRMPFILSVLGAVLLALFWLYPMLTTLLSCFGGSGC